MNPVVLPSTRAELAQYLDHTLLAPTASAAEIEALCAVAVTEQVASVCVSPNRVRLAAELVAGTGVRTSAVIGFPSGAHRPDVKSFEAMCAVVDRADEIDVVLNLGNVLDGDWDAVDAEIRSLRIATGPARVKLIIESAAIGLANVVPVCELAVANGIDTVKTSTGFHPAGGATVEAVTLMSQTVAGRAGVKAAGGIRDTAAALAMIAAGATRIGASATVAILDGLTT